MSRITVTIKGEDKTLELTKEIPENLDTILARYDKPNLTWNKFIIFILSVIESFEDK